MKPATSEKSVPKARNAKMNAVAFCIVVAVTLICFAPDLNNALLDWDDSGYILENIHIQKLSFETLRWAFGEFYLNYWAPLTWLSLAIDYAVWGLNPVGYHLTNNIFHALNAGMFFLVCMELLASRSHESSQVNGSTPFLHIRLQLYCAVLAAVFYAIHPLRVESVAWATERKDVLSLFFGLPAVLFYLRHTRVSATGALSSNYWLSLLFFTLSLMSKSLLVTLPVVLLVLDWFPLKRVQSSSLVRVLLEKAPFFFLSFAASLLTLSAQMHVIEPIDLYTRILNAFKSVVSYLWLTVWPWGVSPFYVHPVAIQGLPMVYALSILVCVLLTIACVVTAKRWPVLLAVWLIYLVTLLPFLGLTQQIGAQAMAGRFTCFSGMSLALLFAVCVMNVYRTCAGSRSAVIALGFGVGIIMLMNAFLTVREISFWKNDVTLWTRVIELSPNTGRAYFQRSHAYLLRRDNQRALSDINQAIVIATNKRYRAMHELYLKRAAIYVSAGDDGRAVDDYTTALKTVTADVRLKILYERGMAYKKTGRNDLASEDFRLSGMSDFIR